MNKKPVALITCSLALGVSCIPLQAQQASSDASASASASAPTDQLQEITVTAERRSQQVLEVPLSIQAETGQQLQDAGVKDMTSLQITTPGFLPSTNNGFVQVYMRGIGNNIFVGADPAVATFIDDVPQIYGAMIDNFADVQRIEILKGAQGGLYGRNATGGVINIVTNQPDTDKMSGNALVRYGSFHTFEAQGNFNLPLGDKLALSVSGYKQSHDAYVNNTAPNTPYSAASFPTGSLFGTPAQTAAFFNGPQSPPPLDNGDVYALRGKLLFKPIDTLSITLAANYADKHDSNSGQFVTTTPGYTQAALAGLFSTFGITTNLPANTIHGDEGQKWSAGIGVSNFSYLRDYTTSGTVVWNAPGFDLTSISAYRHAVTAVSGDGATSTVPFVPLAVATTRQYFYQELRGTSTFDGPLHLLGGATWLNNRLYDVTDLYFLSTTIPYATTTVGQRITNWSVYAQADYDLTSKLNLMASGRYMHEANTAAFTQPIVSGTNSTEHHFIPAATLSYKLGDGTAYARFAEGFKTGGVNIVTAPSYFPNPTGSIFGPETVYTYEVGFKDSLLDHRMQVTSAVFYNKYDNLQINVLPRPQYTQISTAILNAKAARTYGAEGSVTWKVASPVTVGVNAGYLNAFYTDYALSNNPVYSDFNQSGKAMLNAPRWQAAFNADLDQPISDKLRVVGNLVVSYTSDVVFEYTPLPGITPDNIGPSHTLVNARIGVETHDKRFGVYLNADNMFDKVYYIGGNASAFGNLLSYGTRRLILGEIDVHL
jgi:iron complex outermembrane receptor protein